MNEAVEHANHADDSEYCTWTAVYPVKLCIWFSPSDRHSEKNSNLATKCMKDFWSVCNYSFLSSLFCIVLYFLRSWNLPKLIRFSGWWRTYCQLPVWKGCLRIKWNHPHVRLSWFNSHSQFSLTWASLSSFLILDNNKLEWVAIKKKTDHFSKTVKQFMFWTSLYFTCQYFCFNSQHKSVTQIWFPGFNWSDESSWNYFISRHPRGFSHLLNEVLRQASQVFVRKLSQTDLRLLTIF